MKDEPMSRHTSFHIGGNAAVLAQPRSAHELKRVCIAAKKCEIPVLITGNGSNLLVSDDPLNMLVIKTFDSLSGVELRGDRIFAKSGTLLSRIAVFAMQNGLSGFEFAHGIPGTLGGAVFMNAGAYGGEMKDVVVSTEYLDASFTIRQISGAEHDFSYRHSFFSPGGAIILSSAIKLVPGDKDTIKLRMQELAEKRRMSQPLELPSAGSAFKRPKNGYAAAMIEKAGLKGFSVGGAQVSEKHSGFIVNKGGATFDDVLRLLSIIKGKVYENCGAEIEPEIRIIRGGV